MNTRAKGNTFERQVAAAFEDAGFVVRGLEKGGDHLVVSAAGNVLHGEAKRHERVRIPEWIRQQERDCPKSVRRFLVFRQSRQHAYVVEPFNQFLEREARLASLD